MVVPVPGAMRLPDRGNPRHKENPRLLDERGAFAGRAAWQHFGDYGLFVEPCQVQRLQPGGQCLTAESSCRLQVRLLALLQVRSQRDLIASRQVGEFALHAFLNLRVTRRTDRADFVTSRCVLAISFLMALLLLRASCFNEISRTLIPNRV